MLEELKLEFREVDLGDRRRDRRVKKMAVALGRNPSASIPKAMGGKVAGQEAAYRLLGNESVQAEDLHAPHRLRTIERAHEVGRVRVLHDTTELRFSGTEQREGLGWLDGKGQGYLLHGALVTSFEGLPLGMVAYQTLFREGEARGKADRGSRKADYQRTDKETRRWPDVFEMADAQLAGVDAWHLFDAGADDYGLISQVQQALENREHGESHAVFRARHDRLVHCQGGQEKLFKVWGTIPASFTRSAKISERKEKKDNRKRSAKSKKRHPPRQARVAHLEVRAAPVTLPRPDKAPDTFPQRLQLNAVWIREPHPPMGEEPIEWILLTTAPIATDEDVKAIIGHYCGRWVIEEFWKALKTGCGMEKRQLETRRAHLNALAIFLPIAWQLLSLRSLARDHGDEPCTLLTPLQIRLLTAVALRELDRELPENPTNAQVLGAIAGLGGHIRKNGSPGWIVLGRGYEELLRMEVGWELAMATMATKM